MNGYLLDTNVISELRRPKKSAEVMTWIGRQDVLKLFTSDVTMAELCFGAMEISVAAHEKGAPLFT